MCTYGMPRGNWFSMTAGLSYWTDMFEKSKYDAVFSADDHGVGDGVFVCICEMERGNILYFETRGSLDVLGSTHRVLPPLFFTFRVTVARGPI